MSVRASDPSTSHEALRSLDLVKNEECRRVLKVLVDLDHENGGSGATAFEIMCALVRAGTPRLPNVISRRITDLMEAGYAYRTAEKRPGASNRGQFVHRPSPNGCEQVAA